MIKMQENFENNGKLRSEVILGPIFWPFLWFHLLLRTGKLAPISVSTDGDIQEIDGLNAPVQNMEDPLAKARQGADCP
jgi:hypothetical protein